ncbi:MAG TPA: Gfo/Idh/MocA family oxidoreductase [Candidatus Limnocylindria bacterium]|nr:Gfo/Idh/MocA family oxidoreductase [Candidatus Limnocylindria bacterium]
MRSNGQIGAAVIGSGFIGTVHIESLRRIGVTVHGLLGSSPDRGAEAAAKFGIPRAYRDLDELLADADIDVVHVTSPNKEHFPQVKAILAAGKHVNCEKPLAMDIGESAELVRLALDAQERGQVAAVNFNIRFYPVNQHLRQAVADGDLGEIRLISGHYFQDWLLYDTDWNWRLEPEAGGALRAVGDIGSHWVDLTSHISGLQVAEVMADMVTFIPIRQQPAGPVETFSSDRANETVSREIRTEDVASVMIRYTNGARGLFAVSQLAAGRKNHLQYEIDGSLGAAEWVQENPDTLWLGHRDQPNEVLLRNPALMNAAGRAAAQLPGGHVEGFADSHANHFRAVYADVARGRMADRPPYATFADGHEAMLVGDTIARSSRAGSWMAVDRSSAPVAQGVAS